MGISEQTEMPVQRPPPLQYKVIVFHRHTTFNHLPRCASGSAHGKSKDKLADPGRHHPRLEGPINLVGCATRNGIPTPQP